MRSILPWNLAAVLALGLTGCHLARNQGPVPQALLTSRQYSQQGTSAMDRGQWDQAEAMFAKAVKSCPYDAEARWHYAEALWHRGQQWEAIGQMEEASRLTPDDAGLHARVADLRLEMGQVQAAKARVEQALTLDPKLPAAWAARARVLRASGNSREALADYHRALAYAPDDRQILVETADLYTQLKEPHRALALLQSLLETYTPGEEPPQALALVGQAYQAVGRHDDAIVSLQTALARGPHSPEVLCALAVSQTALQQTAEAEAALREALTLNPQHRPSQELLSRLQLAQQEALGQPLRR